MSDATQNARYFMRKAQEAEDRIEELEQHVKLLKANVRGALNMDETTAVSALAWIGRAEAAENLLAEVLRFVQQRALGTEDFPAGWVTRAEAQMKTVEIMRRDQAELMDRPANDAYWATEDDLDGKRRAIRARNRPIFGGR